MWDSRIHLQTNMNLSGQKFPSLTETVKEEAARGVDRVLRDSAQEPGGALGQDGHLRGRRRGQAAHR